jgi:WD40 repeat protein
MSPKYDAFLSYSHASDSRLAPAIQRGLHRLAKPLLAMRAVRIFRDATSMAASQSLWQSIERALEQSRYLIVLCSPRAAQSAWVSREIDWWLDHRTQESILLAVAEGEILWDLERGHFDLNGTDCLPMALARGLQVEPLWVDFRWTRETEVDLSIRHSRFRRNVLDLAAPLHGREKDELDGEDVQTNRIVLRATVGGVVSLAILALTASILWVRAQRAQSMAEAQRDSAIARGLAAETYEATTAAPQLSYLLAVAATTIESSPSRIAKEGLQRVLLTNPQVHAFLSGHQGSVNAVGFSPKGQVLTSAGNDGTIVFWDVATARQMGRPIQAHHDEVVDIAYSPDGRLLASASLDKSIRLWNVLTREPLGGPLTGHSAGVLSVAFSPDGRTLASASQDSTVILWNLENRTILGEPLKQHRDFVRSVAFDPTGRMLASAGRDFSIVLWDVEQRRPIGKPMVGHFNEVWKVAFSPDGSKLASGSADNTVVIWDVERRVPIGAPLVGHENAVWALAFSPDGKALASGSRDGTVMLWDVETGKPMGRPRRAHSDGVRSIAFSNSGEGLSSAGRDGNVVLWSLGSRAPLAEALYGPHAAVVSVAFSPDGRTLATGSRDNSIVLWDAIRRKRTGSAMVGHENVTWSLAGDVPESVERVS